MTTFGENFFWDNIFRETFRQLFCWIGRHMKLVIEKISWGGVYELFSKKWNIFLIFGPIPLKIELLAVHGSYYIGKITFLKNLHFFRYFFGSEKCCSVFQIFKILVFQLRDRFSQRWNLILKKAQILPFKAMSNYVKSRF